MDRIKKILATEEGRIFYVRNINQDFHTQYGFIKKADLKKKDGSKLHSNMKKTFYIFSPSFIDCYKKIKRAPQIIPSKDVASIIAETGISKKSVVVDAGTGSGALACFLANYAKKVASYEIREDFLKVAAENARFLRLKNVEIKHRDVYQGIDERDVDLIVLDLPEPWKVLKHTEKALKTGGFLASYSPTIPQVMDFVNALKQYKNFIHLKTIEIIERQWEVDDRKVRPKSQAIGHSGFVTFCRKIQ